MTDPNGPARSLIGHSIQQLCVVSDCGVKHRRLKRVYSYIALTPVYLRTSSLEACFFCWLVNELDFVVHPRGQGEQMEAALTGTACIWHREVFAKPY